MGSGSNQAAVVQFISQELNQVFPGVTAYFYTISFSRISALLHDVAELGPFLAIIIPANNKQLFCFQRPANERPTEGHEGHDEDLGPGAQEDWQQHSLFGCSENISMDQLPPKLFLGIFLEKDVIYSHTY